jgi:hypothetical protein
MIADRGMDKGIKDMMEANAVSGATIPDGFPGSSPDDKRCPVTPGFVEEIVKSGGEMFYHGEPIKVSNPRPQNPNVTHLNVSDPRPQNPNVRLNLMCCRVEPIKSKTQTSTSLHLMLACENIDCSANILAPSCT